MRRVIGTMGILVLALGLSACGPRAFVKGDYDEDVEATNLLNDRWSETDMQTAVKDLVASALKHRAIANAQTPPIVMVTRLENKTSEHIDTQSITDMVTVELTKSGSVQFVDKAARDDVAEEYEYQNSGTVSRESKKGKGKQIGADLILNGRIDSIVQQAGKHKTVYYKITLNMTNLSTNLIVWTDQKQIRKMFKKQHVGI
jgi:penicillin-binding protein activator